MTLPHFHVDEGPRVVIVGSEETAADAMDAFWNHPGGQRLKGWLGLTSDDISILGSVCYLSLGSGRHLEGLDMSLTGILREFPTARLIPLLGELCHRIVLQNRRKESLEETVQAYDEFLPFFPLPEPRTLESGWYDRNPWFEHTVLQLLRRCVALALEKDRL